MSISPRISRMSLTQFRRIDVPRAVLVTTQLALNLLQSVPPSPRPYILDAVDPSRRMRSQMLADGVVRIRSAVKIGAPDDREKHEIQMTKQSSLFQTGMREEINRDMRRK